MSHVMLPRSPNPPCLREYRQIGKISTTAHILMPPQGSTVSTSAFLPLRILFSSTDVHKEKSKTCHVSGKFPNICIILLWRKSKWVWTILQKFKHNCIQLPKRGLQIPTISCTEILLFNHAKNTRQFLLCHSLFSSKQEMQSYAIVFDKSWKKVA